MALGMTVTKETVDLWQVEVTLTGLTPGVKYDLMRLRAHEAKDEFSQPIYSRILPERRSYWTAVAHRVGWTATATTHKVRDYEAPGYAFQYFIVPTDSVGPYEYEGTLWDTPYPLSRGFLSPTVINFNRELTEDMRGRILLRSTKGLAKGLSLCVVDMDQTKYTARGTELAVMGNTYPVYVADVREARRGSIVFKVDSATEFHDLMEIVFPNTGAIWPVYLMNIGTDVPLMLTSDMKMIPLDVTIEQSGFTNPNIRFVRVDYVEIDSTAPISKRTGDNDDAINPPKANFTISDSTPAVGQWVTLTDTSTGQYDSWDWSVRGTEATVSAQGKYFVKGPHRVRWMKKGSYTVALRVYGAQIDANGHTAGASTRTLRVTVH
jgi:hypothetical protein